MFTNSKILLPKKLNNNYQILCMGNSTLLYIYSNHKKTNEIIETLKIYPQYRKIHICGSSIKAILKYDIKDFYKNIFDELVICSEINEKIKNEINNSKNININIKLSDYFNVMQKRQMNFLDILIDVH